MNIAVEPSTVVYVPNRRPNWRLVWLPLVILLGLSAVFRFTQLDLVLERWLWSPADGWRLAKHPLVQVLYYYGTWPAVLVGGGSALLWIGSMVTGRWQSAQAVSLYLSLLLLIGPGLVINALFKDHFGRSRPRQTTEFGGPQPYRALGEMGPPDGGNSFPSGHAATGFYWLGLFVYFWDRRRAWAWGFCALGLLHGLLMGFGRMAQGRHWPSDILWSAGFVFLTAWGLNWILARRPNMRPAQTSFTAAAVIDTF